MSVENGIVTAGGKKGTVLFFHGNVFHASSINLTPFDRDAVIITCNSVHNLPASIKSPRPDFPAGTNYEPSVCWSQRCRKCRTKYIKKSIFKR